MGLTFHSPKNQDFSRPVETLSIGQAMQTTMTTMTQANSRTNTI